MRIEIEKGPAAVYRHTHPPVRNVNEEYDKHLSMGQRLADFIASVMGSWPFIIIQSFLIIIWMGVNAYMVYMIRTQPGFLKAWGILIPLYY